MTLSFRVVPDLVLAPDSRKGTIACAGRACQTRRDVDWRPVSDRIRIEAPDPLHGFLLLQRLPTVEASVERAGEGWAVEISTEEKADDLADALLETVRAWLRDERLPATTMHVGGRRRRVEP
jgi:hypothetical protein